MKNVVFTTIKVDDSIPMDMFIENQVQRKVSRTAYISGSYSKDLVNYYEFGICTPRLIFDEINSPFLKYVCIDGVFSISASLDENKMIIEWPDREDIADKYQDKRKTLVMQAENAIILNIGKNLVNIPKIQNGLNPIKEILVSLYDLGQISLLDVQKRKKKERCQEYIKFLMDLDFIVLENETIYPGNQMTKYDAGDFGIKEVQTALLGDVLIKGLRVISDSLKIRILTPYLELSNTYYLHSHYANTLLHLDHEEISRHYMEMYRRSKKQLPYQLNSNLIDMKTAKILNGSHGTYYGYDEILEGFSSDLAFS